MGSKKQKEQSTDRGSEIGHGKDSSTRINNAQIEENIRQNSSKSLLSSCDTKQNSKSVQPRESHH